MSDHAQGTYKSPNQMNFQHLHLHLQNDGASSRSIERHFLGTFGTKRPFDTYSKYIMYSFHLL